MVGKLLVAVCLRCEKNRLRHNFKPQHVVSLCVVLAEVGNLYFMNSVATVTALC